MSEKDRLGAVDAGVAVVLDILKTLLDLLLHYLMRGFYSKIPVLVQVLFLVSKKASFQVNPLGVLCEMQSNMSCL
jgi:hypothetical protein